MSVMDVPTARTLQYLCSQILETIGKECILCMGRVLSVLQCLPFTQSISSHGGVYIFTCWIVVTLCSFRGGALPAFHLCWVSRVPHVSAGPLLFRKSVNSMWTTINCPCFSLLLFLSKHRLPQITVSPPVLILHRVFLPLPVRFSPAPVRLSAGLH